jgi:hypothetical protein
MNEKTNIMIGTKSGKSTPLLKDYNWYCLKGWHITHLFYEKCVLIYIIIF